MKIIRNYPLDKLNTFGIKVDANYFCEVASTTDIIDFLDFAGSEGLKYFILGGGSNVLFAGDYEGIVARVSLQGIEIVNEDRNHAYVRAMAGEAWDDLVKFTVEKGYSGIENLSLIPGTVGAAPVQNIGAYGVELGDVLVDLMAFDMQSKKEVEFDGRSCLFAYRDSLFKSRAKGRYLITSIRLKLNKQPTFKLEYGQLKEQIGVPRGMQITVKDVREAVCSVRRSKLPDPAVIGNAGSFFKNPVVSSEKFSVLKKNHPDIVSFPAPEGKVKLAAGWLIDQAGWKGRRSGRVGMYEKQALVIVNHGGATPEEIIDLSGKVRKSVKDQFDVLLENEVSIIE